MKTALAFGLAATAFILSACSSSAPEEKKEETTSNLSASCIAGIKAQPGSTAWRAELDACLGDLGGDHGSPGGGQLPADPGDDGSEDPGAPGGPEVPPMPPGGPEVPPLPPLPPPPVTPTPPNGGGQNCSQSIQCLNGSCTCGSGANKDAACDGTTTANADSCSVLCRTCQ